MYHKATGNYTYLALKMSTNKETIAEKRERLFNQPVTVSELSDADKVFMIEELQGQFNKIALGKGSKSKSADGEKKVANDYIKTFQPAVHAKIEALKLASGGSWAASFAGYLWSSKGYKEDPSKLEDDDEFIRLHKRYAEKEPIPAPKAKAKKTAVKKVVAPDSEDESEPKTTGGAKAKAVVDSEDDEPEVRPGSAKRSDESEPKPKPAAKAPPKPPAPKAKADNTLKTPPAEVGIVQTYKGKEVYTSLSEGAIHVWLNKDGAADEDNYLGVYNPKTKEVEEVFEEEK